LKGVLRISDAATMALHTLALMSVDPNMVYTTKSIARKLAISGAHLAKVFQRLAKAGLVESERGPRGGFRLGRPADDISLLEVYEAIEGPFEPRDCLMSERTCGGAGCMFGDLLGGMNRTFREYMEGKRLAELRELYRTA
jgi:Rrf2 family protein